MHLHEPYFVFREVPLHISIRYYVNFRVENVYRKGLDRAGRGLRPPSQKVDSRLVFSAGLTIIITISARNDSVMRRVHIMVTYNRQDTVL